MARHSLADRVEKLEKAVDDPGKLPARVEALEARTDALDVQFGQFHTDMRVEFSAMREEMRAGFAHVNNRLAKVDSQLAEVNERFAKVDDQFAEVNERFAKVDDQFAQVNERFAKVDDQFAQVNERFAKVDEQLVNVRQEIRQGDEETRRFMRVLHEDVIARIAVLGEQVRRN